MSENDIGKIRESYDKVKAALFITAPFISSLLSRARIVTNRSVPRAGVTSEGVIVINPDFWNKLDWAGKAWVLGHELLHLAFRDHKRQGSRARMAWNLCCDSVNNELLKEMVRCPYELETMSVTLDKIYYIIRGQVGISYEDFLKMSKEELYRLLPKRGGDESEEPRCPRCGSENIVIKRLTVSGATGDAHMKCDNCGYEWDEDVQTGGGAGRPIPIERVESDINKGESEGEVVQEGDPNIYRDGKESDGEDVEERWRESIARAYDIQKTVGTVPAGLARIVNALLKPRIDWRALMKQAFRVGFGKTVVESWKRPSRKAGDDFPGLRRYTLPTVWCLVDCSGSISERELTQFISEVYSIAGDAPVSVVVWDTRVYDIVEAKSRAEVVSKVADRLRGYGGTEIRNALESTLKRMKFRDIVVILSDFEIYDLKEPEVQRLLSQVASKASVAIACSTYRDVDIPGWRFVKIEAD